MDHIQLSGDVVEDALLEQLDLDAQTVDAENPGFASLLIALRAALGGQLDPRVLASYRAALGPRLERSRAQLRDLEIPEMVRDRIAPAVNATEAMLDELGAVLDLIGDYLESDATELLEEAAGLLKGVHDQLRQAI